MPYLIEWIRYGCLKLGIVRFRDPVFRYRCIRARFNGGAYMGIRTVAARYPKWPPHRSFYVGNYVQA